jgi:DNA helicase HerA-like ATPase
LKLIGRVADSSTETSARLILLKDLERKITSEELVIIKNGGEENTVNQILGVLREGLGKNEFLSHTSYKPDVAFMKYGGEPSSSREVYSFSVKPIGSIGENGIEPNRAIIQPRSPVYLLEDTDRPLEWLAKGKKCIWLDAYLEGHKEWKIPVDITYIPYHVAVYGSTGSGKSWLTRYILVPLFRKAGYRVLILDWSGTDYAPYFRDKKVGISDIALDERSVLLYLEDKTDGFAENKNLEAAFDEAISGWIKRVKQSSNEKELYDNLMKDVSEYVAAYAGREDYRKLALNALARIKRKLEPKDLIPTMGRMEVEDVLGEMKDKLVIDMSGVTSEAKLGFFLSLAGYLYEKMEAGEDLNIALIIDEAPQYAPWDPRGIQNETTEMIKNIAALGRKRKLSLTLIAQGIKGDIGINASVRRNLNTQFFGRIHPLDAGGEGGASEWLSPYGITPDTLLQLKPGKFYFAGAMNPSPVPLLITYSVSDKNV